VRCRHPSSPTRTPREGHVPQLIDGLRVDRPLAVRRG
jgi:hypothetical protein